MILTNKDLANYGCVIVIIILTMSSCIKSDTSIIYASYSKVLIVFADESKRHL